ncbi:hypothetical protein BgAZ_207320 [Babesia gibsoni]|uniref:Uncharacterized protein n=1 Tax=Babesia gibsoni TaxID=33632 RepID=A0AAD8PEH1_BABGI|nr:hypothetical protein BgAZ_207320 [Babesia gibsoni]
MRCLRLSALVTLWSLAVVPVSIVYAAANGEAGASQTTSTTAAGGGKGAEGGAAGGGAGTQGGDANKTPEQAKPPATQAKGQAKQDPPAEESFSVCTLGVITTTGMLLFVI